MQVDAARLEGRELILTLSAPTEARKTVYTFKPGNYELTRVAKKRSVDANSYCWILCDKISHAVGLTKEDVYRNAVLDVGKYITVFLDEGDIERFEKAWKAQGIGYQIQRVGDTPAGEIVNAYYGSHLYTSAEMCRLIDYLIQDAQSMGIETMPEEELKSLLESWG